MSLDDLVGRVVDFYGVDNTMVRLGFQVFEAVEDESDGYRSMLSEVKEHTLGAALSTGRAIFFGTPIARVLVKRVELTDFVGYSLVDEDGGHEWLRFGTDQCDDYYSCFVWTYQAKGFGTLR